MKYIFLFLEIFYKWCIVSEDIFASTPLTPFLSSSTDDNFLMFSFLSFFFWIKEIVHVVVNPLSLSEKKNAPYYFLQLYSLTWCCALETIGQNRQRAPPSLLVNPSLLMELHVFTLQRTQPWIALCTCVLLLLAYLWNQFLEARLPGQGYRYATFLEIIKFPSI